MAEVGGAAIADGLQVQYGGSVTADNFGAFIAQPDIDGALVGGASLRAGAVPGDRAPGLRGVALLHSVTVPNHAEPRAIIDAAT